jgi:hypothetical protein
MALLGLLAGCHFDATVPPGATVGCTSTADCGSDVCSPVLGVCVFGGSLLGADAVVAPGRATHGAVLTATLEFVRPLTEVTLLARAEDGRVWPFGLTVDGTRAHGTLTVSDDVPEGLLTFVLRANDLGAGRLVVLTPHVTVDLTPPDLAYARLQYVPAADNPLVALARGDLLAAMQASTTLDVQFQPTEALDAAVAVQASLVDGGAAPVVVTALAPTGLTQRVSVALVPGAGWLDETVVLGATLADDLGNARRVALGTFRVDTIPPVAAAVDTPNGVTHHRAPFAGPTAAIEAAAGAAEPNALLAVLAAGTFRGRFQADADGGLARSAFVAPDDPARVLLLTIDEAGNQSDQAQVRDVVVSTPPGWSGVTLGSRPNVNPALTSDFEKPSTGLARGGLSVWQSPLLYPADTGATLAYDPVQGGVVVSGGWVSGPEFDTPVTAVELVRQRTVTALPALPAASGEGPYLAWDETRSGLCGGWLIGGFATNQEAGCYFGAAGSVGVTHSFAGLTAVSSAGDAGVAIFQASGVVEFFSDAGFASVPAPAQISRALWAPWSGELWAFTTGPTVTPWVRRPEVDAGSVAGQIGEWLPSPPATSQFSQFGAFADVDRHLLVLLMGQGAFTADPLTPVELEVIDAGRPPYLLLFSAAYDPNEHVAVAVAGRGAGQSSIWYVDGWNPRAQVVARLGLAPLGVAGASVVGVRAAAVSGATGEDPRDAGALDGVAGWIVGAVTTEAQALDGGQYGWPLRAPGTISLRAGNDVDPAPVGDPIVLFIDALGSNGTGVSTLSVSEVAFEVHVRY